MSDIKEYQKLVFNNKVEKGFNTTNVETEFLLIYGEVAEAFEAYKNGDLTNLGEELADITIYLLGLAEILNIDLDNEVKKKIQINKNRTYVKNQNGYAKKIKYD